MTRERIEPMPGNLEHDGPCDECADTYRRTMVVTACITAAVSAVGLVAVVLIAKRVG